MVRIKRLLDLLAGVVALISLGPVLGYLDRPLVPLALAAIPAGLWCDHRGRHPLPAWLATLAALAGIAFYGLQVTRAEVAVPVVHAMVVLLIVRLLTPKQGRDYLQIFVLALFILAGSSLIHLEIGFALYLILLVFGVTLGLVLLTVHVSDEKLSMTRPDLARLVRVGLLLPFLSLLLMVGFFAILPRTSHPLWNFLNPLERGVGGLAETVQPGSLANQAESGALAFRAEGPELAPEDRYWRAVVLNRPVGGRWERGLPGGEGGMRVLGPAPRTYTIYPEPRKDRFLVTLDRPLQVTGFRHEQSADQVFIARSPIDHRLRFEVSASPGARLQVKGPVDRDFYLQLPDNVTPRMRRVADDLRGRGDGADVRIAALAEFFRNQGLSYARDGLPTGPGALDAFLFDDKRGYCEFFASAYVTLARLAGIPARLVGGYYGGDYNPLGGYYLVGEDAAHLWVEVLAGDNSWQRVDPSQWAVNAATAIGGRDGLSPLRRLVDSFNYQWVQAVVVFDLARQVAMFRDAGERLRGLKRLRAPEGLWKGVAWLLAGGALTAGVVLLLRRPSREARLVGALRRRLARRYGREALSPGAGLLELGERLDDAACSEFARIYYGAVFRGRALTAREAAQLRRLLKRI